MYGGSNMSFFVGRVVLLFGVSGAFLEFSDMQSCSLLKHF